MISPHYNVHDEEYLTLLERVQFEGAKSEDRTGVGTRSLFGTRMQFDLRRGFPILTTKHVHWKSVVHELLWMMSGSTNVKDLQKHGVTIWNAWADEYGELGPVYGAQWRAWEGPAKVEYETVDFGTFTDVREGKKHDQLAKLVVALQNEPYSRRHVISAWNVGELDQMALPPCHCLFQFYVDQETNSLSCQLYQRSADILIGVPFNLASYSLLLCILADKLGFERGTFTWVGGDTHLYENHLGQATEQLSRDTFPAPTLKKMERGDPLKVTFEEIVLENYQHQPAIKAPVAV